MLLIQNAHIKTMAGADIPNGCLLVEDGKIAAVAPEIDAPVGAKVIDAQGRLLETREFVKTVVSARDRLEAERKEKEKEKNGS